MRFIIHELPYERPLFAGRLRYEREGRPTGATEEWRLTDAVDGYRFLRVDLDARAAPSGRSYLYHLTLSPDRRPEQLKYRLWAEGLAIGGAVVWDGDGLVAAREVNGEAYEDMAQGSLFWFPAATALALLADYTGAPQRLNGVTLETEADDPARLMSLLETAATVRCDPVEPATTAGLDQEVKLLRVRWRDQSRDVWLNADGWPVRLARQDGLAAVAERYVRYAH